MKASIARVKSSCCDTIFPCTHIHMQSSRAVLCCWCCCCCHCCVPLGGYFIGCVPDGKRVKAHLVKSQGELVTPHLVLKTGLQPGQVRMCVRACMCLGGCWVSLGGFIRLAD